jgi:hypothetical protein
MCDYILESIVGPCSCHTSCFKCLAGQNKCDVCMHKDFCDGMIGKVESDGLKGNCGRDGADTHSLCLYVGFFKDQLARAAFLCPRELLAQCLLGQAACLVHQAVLGMLWWGE